MIYGNTLRDYWEKMGKRKVPQPTRQRKIRLISRDNLETVRDGMYVSTSIIH